MLGSQSGRSTSCVNRPIVASEKAEKKLYNCVREIFSTRFRPDLVCENSGNFRGSFGRRGGVGACNVWPMGWIVYSEIQQSFKGRW